MLTKGTQVTSRTLTNMIKKLQDKEEVLVGAHYDSSLLADAIPIATRVEGLTVNNQAKLTTGTIYFRPVGTAQTNILKQFREQAEYMSVGLFLDETTDEPLVETTYEINVVGADSVLSNIQQIPYEFISYGSAFYKNEVTIQGVKHTQITIESTVDTLGHVSQEDTKPITQIIVLLFMNRSYDAQTLLGYWSDRAFTKPEGLKLVEFLSEGSLVPHLIGAVTIQAKGIHTTMYPLFQDFKLATQTLDDSQGLLYVQSDIGVTSVLIKDIKKVTLQNTGQFKYQLNIETKESKLTLLIG